eukprot:190732-Chlamydomonas_euryale.AAC.15
MFLWAPEEEGQFQPGRTNRWWTKHTVVDLQRQLEALGTRLVLRTAADRRKGVLQAVADTGAQAVFFNNLYDPITLVSNQPRGSMHAGRNGCSVPSRVCAAGCAGANPPRKSGRKHTREVDEWAPTGWLNTCSQHCACRDVARQVSDHEIKQALAQRGVECKSFNADLLYEPWEVVDKENQPFTTFEEFWNG